MKTNEAKKDHLIASIYRIHKSQEDEDIKRFDKALFGVEAKLRLTTKDLEYSLLRLSNRESRPDDIERIRNL